MRANYLFLIAALFCGAVYGQAQQGSVEEAISPKLIAADNAALDQLQSVPDSCEQKFPYPKTNSTNKDPYADSGADTCQRLMIRGKRMQCEIEGLVEGSPKKTTIAGKVEMATWARCNGKIAQVLVDGYYMPASEIERRLDVCSSNYYADPGKPPKFSLYQRFLKWYTSNDLTPPPTDDMLEAEIKQSTPLDSNQYKVGLMKCEWMFARSKAPYIDPLPGGSNADPASNVSPAASNSQKKAPAKKAVKKATSGT